MKIKLIATDLDDTLMRPDKSISEYTVSVLQRCRERGIPVCFVTARSLKACERAIKLVSPDYVIACGGALCLRGDVKLLQISLSKSEATDVIRYCLGLSSVKRLQAETVDGDYFVSYTPPRSGDYAHAVHYDFSGGLPCGVYKLVVSIDDKDERRALIESFPNARIYNYTGGPTCFIASRDATKLRGLEAVAAHMGISLGDIAAFGDDTGDADYLAACGYGIAVGNAVDEAKRAAKFTCGSNDDDGVARWLEENVL